MNFDCLFEGKCRMMKQFELILYNIDLLLMTDMYN